MSKKNLIHLILTALLFAAPMSVSGQNFNSLKIMTETNPPFNFEEGGVIKGITTEIVQAILGDNGRTVRSSDIRALPWPRAYKTISNKPNNVLYSMARTAQREKLFKWVGPMYHLTIGVIAHKDIKFYGNSVADLDGFRIGTVPDGAPEQLPIISSIPDTNRFSKGLALSIPFACNLGGLGTPIGTPPNAIAMSFMAEKGLSISFGDWMLGAVPLMLVLLVIVWFILLKMYPPGNLEIEFTEASTEKLVITHWAVIGLFFLTIIGWLATKQHGLSIGTVSIIPVIIAYGTGLLKVKDFKQLPWDVLFMVGGGICLGVGLRQSGLTDEIVKAIPLGLGTVWVLTAFLILTALMTTFMSNTATANLLIPIAISLDIHASLFVIPIAMVCSTAMALPISTPPNAIAYASGIIKSRQMIKAGTFVGAAGLLCAYMFMYILVKAGYI